MPTYEYACKDCGAHLEVVQSFADDALTVCPTCQGTLRKVFSAAGLIFKGSGWHVKDYAGAGTRAGAQGASPAGPSGASDGGASDGGSAGSADSGPAASTGAAKTDGGGSGAAPATPASSAPSGGPSPAA